MGNGLREKYGYLFDNRVLECAWEPDWENAREVEDGNVVCGHCGGFLVRKITPFYAKMSGKSEDTKLGFVCQCYNRELDREVEDRKAEQKRSDIEALKRKSCLSSKFWNVSFGDFDNDVDPSIFKARVRAENYCKVAAECLEKNYGIMFIGAKGTGKTMLMACMANELMEKRHSVYFTSLTDILATIKQGYGNESGGMSESKVMELVTSCDFFFLDDVGTSETFSGSWEVSKIQEIVNARYNSQKPLLMSSNMTFSELAQKGLLSQTVDRLSEMCTVRMVMQGNSYRGKARRSKEQNVPF